MADWVHSVLLRPASRLPSDVRVRTSHNRMVVSLLADASVRPSGVNATLSTAPVWPDSGAPSGLSLRTSHNRTDLSLPADASVRRTKALRTSLQELANRQAIENRALNRALSPGRCRDALRTSANDMKAVDLLISALLELQRALTSGSMPHINSVQRIASRAQEAMKAFAPAQTSRARFRKACR